MTQNKNANGENERMLTIISEADGERETSAISGNARLSINNNKNKGASKRVLADILYDSEDDEGSCCDANEGMYGDLGYDDILSVGQVEVIKAEAEKQIYLDNPVNMKYSWVVLIFILLCYIANQWQRAYISTAYNFQYNDEQTDIYYCLKAAIPNFDNTKYSILAGPAFTVLFAVLVLFTGILTDNFNRKVQLTLACICWSACTFFSGFANTFTSLLLLRMGLGVFQAFCGPPAYSLITDYFPPEKRTTANAVYSLGIYIGFALTNFSILLLEAVGWRKTYFVIGIMGMVSGLISFFVIMEPPRGRFDPNKKPEPEAAPPAPKNRAEIMKDNGLDAKQEEYEANLDEEVIQPTGRQHEIDLDDGVEGNINRSAMTNNQEPDSLQTTEVNDNQPPQAPPKCAILKKYIQGFKVILQNKCTRWILLGGCFRFWQGYTISYFSLAYFNQFSRPDTFGLVNGLSVLIGGFGSNMVAGFISDKYEPVSYRTKPLVCIAMSLLAIPVCIGCFATNFSFWFSMICLSFEYALGEGWTPPAINMILTVIDPQFKGVGIALFLFSTTISGTIALLVIGKLEDAVGADNTDALSWVLTLSTVIPCVLAAGCFFIAMGHYVDFKKQADQAKEAALAKVTNFDQDVRTFSTTQGVDLGEFTRRNGSISLEKMRSVLSQSSGSGRVVSNSTYVKGSRGGIQNRLSAQVDKITAIEEEGSEDTQSQASKKLEPNSLQPKSNFASMIKEEDLYNESRALLDD